MLFLSLFLLLLAFFILLNSISSLRETKSRDVLSSVAATFQTAADPDQNAEVLISTLGAVPDPEKVLDEVERLWLSEIPFVKVDRFSTGLQIMVELPVFQLFVGAEPMIRGDRGDLIAATAHVLSARMPGQVVEMQAILFVENLAPVTMVSDGISTGAAARSVLPPQQTPGGGVAVDLADPGALIVESPAATNAENDAALAFQRVGSLAEALIAGGAPKANLEIGIQIGNPSKVRFRFFIRDEDRAFMTFAKSSDATATAPVADPDPIFPGEGRQ
ncbi:hypothetical protein HH303_17580 [Rhodospirillaceae bacterium KN72]|uniref:Uncharacterized protein n=1 Tax=Pacificispira spongiicola TaxID=2729598 RepID=A0A7Y0E4J2_9PROT|nr:hypothetical protein [Pacificispira spongiicola]NMM46306.1 hypothetical protein [Pacificispira spongiicola]